METPRVYKQKQAAAQTARKGKSEKVFSEDPNMTCKNFCCLCDRVVPLSSMKNHTKSQHKVTLTEYKALYGNPKKQIIKLVYHRCVLCKSSVCLIPMRCTNT